MIGVSASVNLQGFLLVCLMLVSSIKSAMRPIVNACLTRERFDDSLLYDAYLFLFRRQSYRDRRAEERFYQGLLGSRCHLIFDVGANGGQKARIFSEIAK